MLFAAIVNHDNHDKTKQQQPQEKKNLMLTHTRTHYTHPSLTSRFIFF